MYPLLMLGVGAVLLVVLLLRVPLQIPLKQRMQAVCISSLLVLLTLLLSMLYTWQIATLAFVGLFSLFVVVFGKQFEYQGQEDDSDHEYELAPLAATTVGESSTEKQSFRDEPSMEPVVYEQAFDEVMDENVFESDATQIEELEGLADVENTEEEFQPENEEELLDYFQNRPKEMLRDEINEDTEQSGFSRLRMENEEEDVEVDEDFPVRIPPKVDWMEEDKVTDEQPSDQYDSLDDQFEAPRGSEEVEDMVTVRKRLFDELEIDDKKD